MPPETIFARKGALVVPHQAMEAFVKTLEAKPRLAHAAVPGLRGLAEALMPGAAVVASLRGDQPDEINLFTADLNREFLLLAHLVSAAVSAEGGLIVESISSRAQARVEAVLASARIDIWAKERLVKLFEHAYSRVAGVTIDTLTKAGIPTSLREPIEKKIIEAGGKRVGLLDIGNETKEAMFSMIEKGRELGLNPLDTAKMIQEYVPRGRFVNAGSGYRSRLIARTEILHAQRMATLEVYRSSPYVNQVIMFDGESDEECAARNGAIVSFDEAEAEMGDTHPNCVLAFGPY